jgi:hypothetical protein
MAGAFAATLNVDDVAAVKLANKMVADKLMSYYINGQTARNGAFNEDPNNPTIDGMQWYESGIAWGAMMDYVQNTGDQTHATTVVNAITMASYNGVGSFLGRIKAISEGVEGKWNDDIGWWVLGGNSSLKKP